MTFPDTPFPEFALTSPALTPGLMLVHGNQPEMLRDLLVEWMKRYPLAPLENEIILVQSNGIAQWLKLALAADATDSDGNSDAHGDAPGEHGGCGIAAALEISLPARFLWQVYRAVLGRQAVPENSPFDKGRLLWRLMRLLPQVMGAPEYAPLLGFLAADSDRRKRFQLAERLADLFDQYQVYRADWLAAWAAGDDVLIDARGRQTPLAGEQRWQAALWRALLADVDDGVADAIEGGVGGPGEGREGRSSAGRAAVHEAFLARAENWPPGEAPAGLPRRVMVFGISSLPRQSLEVLAALGRWTQVLMCVHNPCQHYWADIVADRELLRRVQARQQRRQGAPVEISEELLHLHAQPLLAAWGKQGRDFIGLLDEHDDERARAHTLSQFLAIEQRIDLFKAFGGKTLLQQLQDDILELRPLQETIELWPAVDPGRDASIRFHIAHSAQREVEILHDQLLAACNADASLRPRDIIVMVPDIDTYAPHIQAVFGLLEASDSRYLPFSVADQGQRHFDPLVNALEKLLDLPQSRLAVSDILDLLDVPALRQRFAIAEDDLPQLHRWIRGANIRWGLHAEQRASLDLPPQADAAAANSWLFGLRRMLLGYAVGADAAAWQEIEPYDEIGGIDAALLGPLLQLFDALDASWRTLREPATVADWCLRLRQLMADFFATDEGGSGSSGDSGDGYTLLQLDTALERWQEACDEAALGEALPLSVVGDYWLSRLDEGGLSQRFFGGVVTFATLMPMRAIPFRRVCLLGMNDGDYPRSRIPMDFDLMVHDYRPGDRSRREDDRYLFLEALLSAREALHVSWVGRSIKDNSLRPPSVLVGQLRDHLAAGWMLAESTAQGKAARASTSPGEALLAALTIEHRLQPFSSDYFPAHPQASRLFTYAQEWRPDAAGGAGTSELASASAGLLPPLLREEPLSLQDLGDFLKQPVRAFFRQRLNVSFERDDPASEDQEPFDLDGLGRWLLQDELIRAQAVAVEQGQDLVAARATRLASMARRGDLPAGGFGEALAEELLAPMDALFSRYQAALARWPQMLDGEEEIRFQALVDGQALELADWLGGIRLDGAGQRGRVVLESSDLVSNNHYRGDRLIRHWVRHLALHVAGGPLTTLVLSKVGDVELPALDPAQAESHLNALLAAWQRGMREPLPLAARTAFDFLKAGPDKARETYEGSSWQPSGERQTDAYLLRAFRDFAALTASGEFKTLAERLLRPLLEAIPAKARGETANGAQAGKAAGASA
ncbi:MAG: Exodeoxyribonuclease V gamma chain [Candidatus Accumulibacter appositus]|uniref:RecBCD enzyme subunit RecC n=2 Tax=Candidatus Accumulibacter TaxID=327159 RepID=A0A011PNB4_9PROT|nr:MAG: Exodeoxyribonuclease V gamma chain [Candidatus Accumulibacter appositus]